MLEQLASKIGEFGFVRPQKLVSGRDFACEIIIPMQISSDSFMDRWRMRKICRWTKCITITAVAANSFIHFYYSDVCFVRLFAVFKPIKRCF